MCEEEATTQLQKEENSLPALDFLISSFSQQ